FGYGHAVSVIIVSEGATSWDVFPAAKDVILYEQQGCLSPHIIYYEGKISVSLGLLEPCFEKCCFDLRVPPVTAHKAITVRQARDVALFSGWQVLGDESFQTTMIINNKPTPYPEPVGHSVIYISPVQSPENLRELLQPVWGIVTCAGVAGELSSQWGSVLREAGVSRICKPGEMQTPPLDWANGNRDLLAELLRLPQ
ncbi:MAG: hypothetical protein H7Y38_06375, partial [Armatimonadetes bacterium]|nr:hypothetical protein [Armatimonadota bacterium]